MYARRKRHLWPAFVVGGLALLAVGLLFGGHPSWLPGPLRRTFVADTGNDRLVNQVLDLLSKDYYRKVNRTQLVNAGLAAAVASLHDPYSHYYDPTLYQRFQNTATDPHDSGIGVSIQPQPSPRGLVVQSVFRGSPAARAGLSRGDVIEAVGSTSLAHKPKRYATSLVKGKPGTKVQLTVASGGQTRRITVMRANVVVPVAGGRILDYHGKKIGYVLLTSFAVGSGNEVRQQVTSELHHGAQAFILDLRENGGGLVNEAVNVASAFIPDGTIVSTDGRSQPRQVYMAKRNAIARHQPMVVLVDSGTASASEIVTAALEDRGRATVVGTHTYGKGVFQEIQPLVNGGALDFTVGEYFTPNGQNLGGGGVRQGRGIQPNVYADTAPSAKSDTALTVAERTVAAKIR